MNFKLFSYGSLSGAILLLTLACAPCQASLEEICDFRQLAAPSQRVSLLRALPHSDRYGIVVSFNLKNGDKIIALAGAVSLNHSSLVHRVEKLFGDEIASTETWGEVRIINPTNKLGRGTIEALNNLSGGFISAKDEAEISKKLKLAGIPIEDFLNYELSNDPHELKLTLKQVDPEWINEANIHSFDPNRDPESQHLSSVLKGRHWTNTLKQQMLGYLYVLESEGYIDPKKTQPNPEIWDAGLGQSIKRWGQNAINTLEGLLNDGLISAEMKEQISTKIQHILLAETPPSYTDIVSVYESFNIALSGYVKVGADPDAYIEIFRIKRPRNVPRVLPPTEKLHPEHPASQPAA